MAKTMQWKDKIIYQIFPRSFKDSNNDGDGDIKGITSKLPYLKDLGITAIWLCPTYETRFADAGYDVLDYKSVWKQFGTLADFKKMTAKAKEMGIDIIMDIVLNHVSDEHEWFKKAIESEDNVEHNYFIWRDKFNSKEEENAPSLFGGSGWEYVPSVKKSYFHLFAKEQVDLNWNHPDTIDAMADVIDFWYSIGVKGFRLDAIKHVDKEFTKDGIESAHSWRKNSVKQLKAFMKKAFSDKPDAFTMGEASGINLEEAIKYGTGKDKVSDNYYNFAWWHLGWGDKSGRNDFNPNIEPTEFVRMMKPFQESTKIKPELMTNFLSNHDTSRAVSRWGDENVFWKESAKTLAMMMFAAKGMPSIYYGEEIGMLNPRFKGRSEFRDVDALNHYKKNVDEEKLFTEDEMTKYHNMNSRDNCRTPMAWDSTTNAGFNKGATPWIKVGYGYEEINVKAQQKDPSSILNFYKEIIALRKSKKYGPILVDGKSKMDWVWETTKNTKTKKQVNTGRGYIKYTRTLDGNKIVAVINITKSLQNYKAPNGKVISRSYSDNKKINNELRPFESIMFFIPKKK